LENRIEKIKEVLDTHKAEDITAIDLADQGYIVDYVVIATALNNKHSIALLNHLRTDLKNAGEEFVRIEEDENWSVIDLGDILIHIMVQEHREKYNLEEFLSELKQ